MSEKLYEVLNRASLFLEKYNREPRVAEILLMHHLKVTRNEFYMMMRDLVSAEITKALMNDVKLHADTGVPVQHITGIESFYGEEFHVNSHVLIPRPETEELVEHVIQLVGNQSVTIADIGTGSGVIAISLAKQLKEAKVLATDISQEALKVAKKNAQKHNAAISFYQGDFLEALISNDIRVDILVSNPPYIARKEEAHLSDTVKNFDPHLALFADEEGLYAYRKIISDSSKILNDNGKLAFEIGHTQSKAVTQMIKEKYPKSMVQTIKDINGKDRIVSAAL